MSPSEEWQVLTAGSDVQASPGTFAWEDTFRSLLKERIQQDAVQDSLLTEDVSMYAMDRLRSCKSLQDVGVGVEDVMSILKSTQRKRELIGKRKVCRERLFSNHIFASAAQESSASISASTSFHTTRPLPSCQDGRQREMSL